MSELTDRIAAAAEAAIREYENLIHNGRRFDLVAVHVAERVAAALQLTEETREVDWYHDYCRDKKTEHRWVSEWIAAEEKP